MFLLPTFEHINICTFYLFWKKKTKTHYFSKVHWWLGNVKDPTNCRVKVWNEWFSMGKSFTEMYIHPSTIYCLLLCKESAMYQPRQGTPWTFCWTMAGSHIGTNTNSHSQTQFKKINWGFNLCSSDPVAVKQWFSNCVAQLKLKLKMTKLCIQVWNKPGFGYRSSVDITKWLCCF